MKKINFLPAKFMTISMVFFHMIYIMLGPYIIQYVFISHIKLLFRPLTYTQVVFCESNAYPHANVYSIRLILGLNFFCCDGRPRQINELTSVISEPVTNVPQPYVASLQPSSIENTVSSSFKQTPQTQIQRRKSNEIVSLLGLNRGTKELSSVILPFLQCRNDEISYTEY